MTDAVMRTETIVGASDLAPVRVENWILFASEEEFWIRDLDLAEHAGLEKTRNVRAVIKKAIDDGGVTICDIGARGAGAGPSAEATIARSAGDGPATIARGARDGPRVRVEKALVPIGSGAVREVDEYYLNEEAALFIVTRLRTRAAIHLTRAIIRVFVMVRRGFPAVEAPAASPAALEEARLVSVIDARVQAALASREPHETNPDALALIVRALDVDRARMARTHRFLNFLRQEVAQLSRWERGLFTSENGYEYDRGLEPFHKAGRELVARWHHIAERMEELLKHEE